MNNLNTSCLNIHHLLHGYDDGHCLLAGSIKPDTQSSRTILSLSDLSGQGLIPNPNGYLTGYPLPHMKAYALARTWAAPEMARPGCVWTHTLLIDFTDLVAISDAASILDLFIRPKNISSVTEYCNPLCLNTNVLNAKFGSFKFSIMFFLLKAIYEITDNQVFAEATNDINADLASMLLWLQQWPRLRRNFRFCTLTLSDRSGGGDPFDLQFLPLSANTNSVIRKNNRFFFIDIDAPLPQVPDELMMVLTTDAIEGNMNSDLRKFLWRYGAETDAGRRAFLPLSQIWLALKKDPQPDVIVAVDMLNKIEPIIESLTLRVLKSIIQLSADSKYFTTAVIAFLIKNLSLIDKIEFEINKVAHIFVNHAPEHIWPFFFSESDLFRSLASAAMNMMPKEKIIHEILDDENLFCIVLDNNPKLAESALLWSALSLKPNLAEKLISKLDKSDLAVLQAMFNSDNTTIAELSIRIFGPVAVSFAIDNYDHDNDIYNRKAACWLTAAKNNPKYFQSNLSIEKKRNFETLSFIASLMDYRLRSLTPDRDEWVIALNNIRGDINKRSFSFCSFLLARAISGSSPEPVILIKYSFDFVHESLRRSNYDSPSWSILDSELPRLFFWSSWDKASRVRLGVVKFFILNDLPANDFLEITKSPKVFELLAELSVFHSDGKKYLRKVKYWIKNNGDGKYSQFAKIVEKIL